MKSLQKSWGKICPDISKVCGRTHSASNWTSLVTFFLVGGLVGCAVTPSSQSSKLKSENPGVSPKEVSLELDKRKIEELRKNIPPERRAENDQLKEILSLMGEVKDHPSRIREKYTRTTRRMRDVHRRQTKRERDLFNREERKLRDEFYRDQKSQREKFLSRKPKDPERKEFFSDQDLKRREFIADQNEKRNQFNSDLRIKGDDFNFMMREKDRDFQAELKNYTRRYDEFKKSEAEQQKNRATGASTEPPTPLRVGDDNK